MLDVGYIKYKQNKLAVRVSYKTLKALMAETGKGIEQIGDDMNGYEILLYHSLKVGAKYSDVEFTLKLEDMEDVLDECFYEFVNLIPKFFPSSDNTDSKKKIQK